MASHLRGLIDNGIKLNHKAPSYFLQDLNNKCTELKPILIYLF